MRGPYNAAAHTFFVLNGYAYVRVKAKYFDDPLFDIYTSDAEEVFVSRSGVVGRGIPSLAWS